MRRLSILVSTLWLFAALFPALAVAQDRTTRYDVPMRDGVLLATDVYLPEGDGPFPVVLARSIYNINGSKVFGLAFSSQGMAFVAQQTRGYYDSEGKDQAFTNDAWGEHPDGADCLKWLRDQSWCNGKIGTIGISALAISSQLLAGIGEPLDAQVIIVGASQHYGALAYQGGVLRKSMVERWLQDQGSEHIIDEFKAHPSYDDYWKQFDVDARVAQVSAPALHIGGWWDIFGQSTLNSFVSRQEHGGESSRGSQHIVMGPWLHGAVREPGDLVLRENFNHDFNSDSFAFLRHHLFDDAPLDLPAVRYYTIGDVEDENAPGNEWRTADAWPPFDTAETPLYLAGSGALNEDAPDPLKLTYRYDPADPVPTHGGPNLVLPAGPFDQREVSGRSDVLAFQTEPLDVPIEITGRVTVRLFVSSTAPDTDFTAKLIDIYPNGREILMLDGIQRLKFRDGFEQPNPLTPGEVGELEIDLWSISLIVNKGHRIGVQISSSNFPRFEVNPNTGEDFPAEGGELYIAENTVHTGESYPSAILLPVRPE